MWTKSKQKQNQVRSHSNWPSVLLLDLAHKQCSGIIKGWLHCLTSESKGRFLVSNILIIGSAWCLVMAQIQFSFKKKYWTSKTLANPPPPYVQQHLVLTLQTPPPSPLPSLKVNVVCVLPLMRKLLSERSWYNTDIKLLSHFLTCEPFSEEKAWTS